MSDEFGGGRRGSAFGALPDPGRKRVALRPVFLCLAQPAAMQEPADYRKATHKHNGKKEQRNSAPGSPRQKKQRGNGRFEGLHDPPRGG